jgi:hypothetical protein
VEKKMKNTVFIYEFYLGYNSEVKIQGSFFKDKPVLALILYAFSKF